MRSIHAQIIQEYGKNTVKTFRRWEKLEIKMAELKNHRRFTLRCLSKGLIPVSIKLKTKVHTPKGNEILRKAERMLMNERVRNINNTITMLNCQADTCIYQLESTLNQDVMEKCLEFINKTRERRHQKTMMRQIKKFEKLLTKTDGRSNIQSDRDGGNKDSNGTFNTTGETTQTRDTEEAATSTTTAHNNNNNNNNNKAKWVHNLSKTPLTEAQEKALAHGPNFAITTKEPPVSEYILQIERVCQQLEKGKAEELRGEIKQILKKTQLPKPNITQEEAKAIEELRRDKERVILTADKGVSMVVLDTEDYIKKSEELLNQPTYKLLSSDPTTKHKNRLISTLKSIKAEGGIDNTTYKRLYPTGAGSPKYYGLPKIHKQGVPLRPIVSSRGSATYETAKELAKILKLLVGKSPHHVQNNQDFLDSIKGIKIKPEECIMSYDVSALFTSIPVEPAIKIIEQQLKEDKDLHSRTNMKIHHIISLLRFCLSNSYFSFQGRFYQQTQGAAMGSPISPVVANLFMEDLEVQAIRTSPTPPSLWKRFVDDTFTIIKKEDRNSFPRPSEFHPPKHHIHL